jgi:hypothetical protein
MSPRSFGILAAATALSLVLAGWAVGTRDVPASSAPINQPLFGGLLDQLDQVAVIKIAGEGKTATIRRDGDVWRVEDRGGYPADPAKVREVARGLAGLEIVEAKTSSPDRLGRLQLEDPAAKDAKSRLVSLEDAQGRTIAAAVLGKEKYDLYGGGRGGFYVRRNGEEQAWLAAGQVNLPSEPMDWITTQVADIPMSDVARVTLAADSPSPILISKPDRNANAFTLDSVPAGQNADAEKLDRVAGVLEGLTMEDVQPASAKPIPPEAPKARFETWDGLVITASLLSQGEGDAAEDWVRLEASASPSPLQPAAAPANPPGAGETKDNPAAANSDAATDDQATPGTAEPLPERVAELNRRFEGWSYKLPNWLAERLVYKREDLLAKPAEPNAS